MIVVILGNIVRVSGVARNAAGVAVAPASATVAFRRPDGTFVAGANATAGTLPDATPYVYFDYRPTTAGSYGVRMVTTNPDSAEEDVMEVLSSPFP